MALVLAVHGVEPDGRENGLWNALQSAEAGQASGEVVPQLHFQLSRAALKQAVDLRIVRQIEERLRVVDTVEKGHRMGVFCASEPGKSHVRPNGSVGQVDQLAGLGKGSS